MSAQGASLQRVAAGWCTFFDRPWAPPWWYRRLRFAYRAPSLFLATMAACGVQTGYLGLDESLDRASLSQRSDPRYWVKSPPQILWVTTHGEFNGDGYQFDLHRDDLPFKSSGLGYDGPTVLILDTCHAVNFDSPLWSELWEQSVIGPDPSSGTWLLNTRNRWRTDERAWSRHGSRHPG